MKLGLVIFDYNERRGGAERQCSLLARALHDGGHEVHAFAHRMSSDPAAAGLLPHRVGACRLLPGQRHVSFARHLVGEVRLDEFDAVLSFSRTYSQHVLRLGGGIHRAYLEKTASEYAPFGWMRVLNPKERAILRLEAASLAASPRIIAVSQRVKDEAVEHYNVDPSRIDVVRNGVDGEAFHPRGRAGARYAVRKEFDVPYGAQLLLFVGGGFRRKGLQFAIRALTRLPEARLMVVGSDRKGRLKRLAKRLRVAERVISVGTRDDVARFYAAADALVHPALYDPAPNVVLEAMACGTPVILTPACGPAEIVTNGREGFLASHPDEIVAAVERLRDPRVATSMGEAARETALRWPVDRFVRETLAVLSKVPAPIGA